MGWLVGTVCLFAIVVFGPVDLDYWTEFGIVVGGSAALLTLES